MNPYGQTPQECFNEANYKLIEAKRKLDEFYSTHSEVINTYFKLVNEKMACTNASNICLLDLMKVKPHESQ
jgi:hypothetical protein